MGGIPSWLKWKDLLNPFEVRHPERLRAIEVSEKFVRSQAMVHLSRLIRDVLITK